MSEPTYGEYVGDEDDQLLVADDLTASEEPGANNEDELVGVEDNDENS